MDAYARNWWPSLALPSCVHICGLPGQLEHASYIDNWLQALKRDKRLIFVAAGKAQAAADYALRVAGFAPTPGMEELAA